MAVGVLYQEQGAYTLLLVICIVLFLLLTPLFVLLTCPLLGTRNYCDLDERLELDNCSCS